MPQMIGAAIQSSSANDWRQFAPSPIQSGGGAPGGSGGVIGNIGPLAAGMFARGGGSPADAASIYAIQQGGGSNLGNLSRGVSAAQLANSRGMFGNQPGLGGALGAAGGGLQFIQGMQRGGVSGYGSAMVGGLRAASGIETLAGNPAMAGTLGAAAGYIAAPLALYSAIKNWQSGNTGSDALQGAEAGAAIGSIVPGVGTVIGAVVGGLVGAASSAFGGGKTSGEASMARNVDQQLASASNQQRMSAIASMSPPQAFQMINGYMNAHDSSPGHSEQIQQVFGKNGVSNMMGQMLPAINTAIKKDPSLSKLSPQGLYDQVVAPWLKSKGASISPTTRDVHGNPEGQNLIDAITGFVGAWQTGAVHGTPVLGAGGETMTLPLYGS
jgi:hypothetical protein